MQELRTSRAHRWPPNPKPAARLRFGPLTLGLQERIESKCTGTSVTTTEDRGKAREQQAITTILNDMLTRSTDLIALTLAPRPAQCTLARLHHADRAGLNCNPPEDWVFVIPNSMLLISAHAYLRLNPSRVSWSACYHTAIASQGSFVDPFAASARPLFQSDQYEA